MKKILSLLTSLSIASVSSSNLVSCQKSDAGKLNNNEQLKIEDKWIRENNQMSNDFTSLEPRTSEQILEQEKISKIYNIDNWNHDKKVIILGLDGIAQKSSNKFSFLQKNNENYIQYKIPGWESITGWRNIFYGNMWGTGKTIFEENQKFKGIKQKVTVDWDKFNYKNISQKYESGTHKIFKKSTDFSKINFKNYSYDKKFDIDFSQKVENTISKIDTIFNYEKKDINNFNFNFLYDTYADNYGHHGISSDSKEVQKIYYKYDEMMWDIYKEYNNENNLIIYVTDHGRNKDGKGHDWYPSEENNPRESWIWTNKKTEEILERKLTNFFDVKELAFKWLKKN